ncbi:MAG: tRNA (adenosine(37)-N6)-threonylcarbamoyltransferase complex transferase subunit TsaD [Flavobacteriales bacterium]|nr:tRNA (adenosine(37)-N6)-threonylcarbamoyltransferase complex transferase subunit TsaD [Flavobacteriales bacterium]
MVEPITILAIESSCDDTSAAVLKNHTVFSNVIASQKVHEEFGGVVPELASRAHQQNIIPVVDQAIKSAGIRKTDIDAIAYTKGPGLLGSLLVGSSFAKGLSSGLDIPLIEVNHMQAHILAHLIDGNNSENSKPNFPFLCLTVSGGHTQIVRVDSPLKLEVIGKTLDDAAGGAFDKVAKILGLPYPGGPLIDKYAVNGNELTYSFPISKVDELNFSFSGLKTAFLYFIRDEMQQDEKFIDNNLANICASIQYTIVSTLLRKLQKAVKQTGITEVAIAGGVSANSSLRGALISLGQEYNWNVFIPKFEYCTDNAAMIGIVGMYKYKEKQFASLLSKPEARLSF